MDDLKVCGAEGYLSESELCVIKELGWRVHNLINGYGRYRRKRKASKPDVLRESSLEYETENESASCSGHGVGNSPTDPF